MGQNLVFRTITYLTDFHILELLIGGATCSGSWLCIDALDRLTSIQTSIITPWIQNLQECLKAIHSKNRGRAKACKELVLPYSGKLTVSKSAFMCFTISPGFPGRTDLPDNLVALMRPLNLMRSKMKPILECLFYSAGVIEFKDLARKIDLFTTLWNGLLNTKKKLEMSLWLTILKRLLEEKLIPSEENLGEKIRRLLYGSLTAKDLDYADSILIHVFQVWPLTQFLSVYFVQEAKSIIPWDDLPATTLFWFRTIESDAAPLTGPQPCLVRRCGTTGEQGHIQAHSLARKSQDTIKTTDANVDSAFGKRTNFYNVP